MCKCFCWFICFSIIASVAVDCRLPEDMQKCRIENVTCVTKQAQYVFENYAKGIPAFGLIQFDPLKIKEMKVTEDAGKQKSVSVNLMFRNVQAFGLQKAKMHQFRIKNNTSTLEADIRLSMPRCEFIGDYLVEGNVLLLPITGRGPFNLTSYGLNLRIRLNGDFVDYHNKTYIVLKTFKSDMTMDRFTVRLENLFNGNKMLGDTMNNLLNDNWQELNNELSPAFVDAFGKNILSGANKVFAKNSVDKLFVI